MARALSAFVCFTVLLGCSERETGHQPVCGDGVCEGDESPITCSEDCGTCGNGICDPLEQAATCPQDCTGCGNGVCDGGETPSTCPADCTCGNGVCDAAENSTNCPQDCVCGDGTCDGGENPVNCPQDCGCGNNVFEPQFGEECEGFDFGGLTCLDVNCTGGILSCNADCTLSASTCTGCQIVCGDGVRDVGEECDGSDFGGMICLDVQCTGGILSCNNDCTISRATCTGCQPVCGDGVVEGSEQCDGNDLNGQTCQSLGLGFGTLACNVDCTFNVSGCGGQATCGNGIREFPESCDGNDMGGATCQSLGFGGGTLACTVSCSLDTSNCTP